jgi:hypothetical protein
MTSAGDGPTPEPWYKSTLLVVALVLIALGAGNWITGEIRLREHEAILSSSASHGDAQPHGGRPGPSQEEIEIARGRMDFYHVVASGGRLMTMVGFVLLAFALARRLRPQAKRSRR